jgi:hypothetical protein
MHTEMLMKIHSWTPAGAALLQIQLHSQQLARSCGNVFSWAQCGQPVPTLKLFIEDLAADHILHRLTLDGPQNQN